MKFSQTTLLAVLASSAFVSAAPAIVSEQSMVKREDVNDVLAILKEIKEHNAKREFLEGDALIEHDKRADSALGNLITALTNSGIIGQVWNTLTTDSSIKSSLSNIIQSAIQTAVVQGPALISAIWNSGLLGDIFNTFLNDSDLRSAFLGVAQSIFGTAVNLITSWLSGSSSSSTTTTSAASTSTGAAAKRELLDLNAEYIDKRDLSSIISFIVQEISDSGIVSSLVNKVLADPTASINFLTSAFKNGLVIAEDVYSWAKQSGLWDTALSYIENNAGTWASAIASFLGNALKSGTVSSSEIDNANTSVSARSTTTTSTSAAAVAAAAGTTAATGTAAAAAATTTAAATASSGSNAELNSLIAKYGGSSATAAATSVDTSGLSGSVGELVSAAAQAASSLKRRNY
ncbi:hypothetical protein CANMA_002841 [Candida margitis]|uniref:uncharacterized protein n=1 Tax=Candida margitis TaxID=1775924 RepID=UPI002227E594|nr:uncharacterized protein CANMA_002841 [Candida margitis]KAI5967661.1 hypothetical protein CANMA_002841 [Candida margitis]